MKSIVDTEEDTKTANTKNLFDEEEITSFSKINHNANLNARLYQKNKTLMDKINTQKEKESDSLYDLLNFL